MALPNINQQTFELEVPSTDEIIKYRPFLVKEEKVLLQAQESGKTKDHVMMIKSKSDKWRYSKLQVVQLLSTIKSLSPEKRNQVMEDLFLYASSQSQYSAPYMKME